MAMLQNLKNEEHSEKNNERQDCSGGERQYGYGNIGG